jgi:hypothetical protein
MKNNDFLNILVFGHTLFGARQFKIKREALRIIIFILIFTQLSITFFLCDYIQVRNKSYLLNQLRETSQSQKSQIQFFSASVEDLEKKILRLEEFDRRIRIIANLEEGSKGNPFIGMGGYTSDITQWKLETLPSNKTDK